MPRIVHIVFDSPPSHEAGRFIEVEYPPGKSISFGEWIKRSDGYWVLAIEDYSKDIAICKGEYVGTLDNKPVLGNIFDVTDGAWTGWWRGHDHASKKFEEKVARLEIKVSKLKKDLKKEQDYALTLLERLKNL